MPIETKPKFKLGMLTRDTQPMGSKPYYFKSGESFTTIAQALKLDAQRLIKYNFGTTDPEEVNWYLREYIGYVRPTHDGKNWMFDPGRAGVKEGRKFIYVPLTHDERAAIVRHYHNQIMTRMRQLIDEFGNPEPKLGLPGIWTDPGRYDDKEMQYLSGIVGFAETTRALIWPEDYAAQTGRDYLEPPPEVGSATHPKPASDERPPRGKGYGKGFDAAVAFWDKNIATKELHNEAELLPDRPSPALPASSTRNIRVRIGHELGQTNARDLFDRMKKFIEDERRRFHGVNPAREEAERQKMPPYVWGRP